MALEQAVPYKYIDPMDDENNEQSPTTIGVKWNPSDSREVMLEKIITQKYISLFPSDGYEAWTELRRTGYPKLLPIFNL
ncbi:MAG: SusD/RagB family nutrient-binding outer membrane lipoprotein, partial [Muribaculaceae bacterium]|nr:SusD/RagB family nutrient-binding outer membrane lipoprotein [Muribaculaceae bacterium]